ncbi:MAG: hypothetical protein ABFD64_02135 [Armatimonadota bacterium]
MSGKYKFVLPDGIDQRFIDEMPDKGYISDAMVIGEDGTKYPVSFFDPVRLTQELECCVKLGQPYFTEPGIIVLPEVTMENILHAVDELGKEGFFEHTKPWSYKFELKKEKPE